MNGYFKEAYALPNDKSSPRNGDDEKLVKKYNKAYEFPFSEICFYQILYNVTTHVRPEEGPTQIALRLSEEYSRPFYWTDIVNQNFQYFSHIEDYGNISNKDYFDNNKLRTGHPITLKWFDFEISQCKYEKELIDESVTEKAQEVEIDESTSVGMYLKGGIKGEAAFSVIIGKKTDYWGLYLNIGVKLGVEGNLLIDNDPTTDIFSGGFDFKAFAEGKVYGKISDFEFGAKVKAEYSFTKESWTIDGSLYHGNSTTKYLDERKDVDEVYKEGTGYEFSYFKLKYDSKKDETKVFMKIKVYGQMNSVIKTPNPLISFQLDAKAAGEFEIGLILPGNYAGDDDESGNYSFIKKTLIMPRNDTLYPNLNEGGLNDFSILKKQM